MKTVVIIVYSLLFAFIVFAVYDSYTTIQLRNQSRLEQLSESTTEMKARPSLRLRQFKPRKKYLRAGSYWYTQEWNSRRRYDRRNNLMIIELLRQIKEDRPCDWLKETCI